MSKRSAAQRVSGPMDADGPQTDVHARILDAAAQLINTRGVGAVRLGEIADSVGLARKSLYYYVQDRSGLIFQCYHRTCAALDQDLREATESESSPSRQIRAFVERHLDFDRPEAVALSDIDSLPDARRKAIVGRMNLSQANLSHIIEQGVVAGEFGSCNASIAAHLLLGMIHWSRISSQWTDVRDTRASRQQTVRAILDVLFSGISVDPKADWRCQTDVETLQLRAYNPFDRKSMTDARIDQVAAVASRLFNRRGIESTSMDDIVAALGTSKGSLYHHFDSKSDVVYACYKRAFRLQRMMLDVAMQSTGNHLGRIGKAIHLNTQAQMGSLTPLVGQPGLRSLPVRQRTEISRLIRRVFDAATALYEQGEIEGSIRRLDIPATESVIAGSMAWLPRWLPRSGERTAIEIADDVNRILVHGLARR